LSGKFMRESNLPIHSHVTSDGWESNGLSYDDYRSMHLTKRKSVAERRLPTPDWATNDKQLRDVIVCFMEKRAGFKKPRNGTPEQRLARANARRLCVKHYWEEKIEARCKEYVTVTDPARRKKLGELIESMDTIIRFIGKEGALACGVVYRYYRLGENSVEVAAALGTRPPHVRQILWRLHKAARYAASVVRISMHINLLGHVVPSPSNASDAAKARWARWREEHPKPPKPPRAAKPKYESFDGYIS
jgi:hypothetical protein